MRIYNSPVKVFYNFIFKIPKNMPIHATLITFYANDLFWVVALIICPELLIIVWRVVWPPFDLCYQLPAAFDASSQKMVLCFHRGIITINFIGQLIFDRLLVPQRVSATYFLYLWKNDCHKYIYHQYGRLNVKKVSFYIYNLRGSLHHRK